MRRRLAIAIAASVLAAIVLVGAGTFVLARNDARDRAADELATTVRDLAAALRDTPAPRLAPVTRDLVRVAEVDSLRVVDRADVPAVVGDETAVLDGRTAIGAAPLRGGRWLVATRDVDLDVGRAGRWFVVAAIVTVALGGLVGVVLARSVTRRLAEVGATADGIAGGDLTARSAAADVDGDELGRLAASVNTMAAALERADAQERQFLLAVSHDLRTPLTSIRGWAEAIVDGAAPDAQAAAGTVLAEATRLERLVDDLLDLARIRTRRFSLDLRPVDLVAIARAKAEGRRADLRAAGVTVTVHAPETPVVVQGDADRVAQIVGNLVDNAGRYAASRVAVTVGPGGVLVVEDDGPGLPGEPARGAPGAGVGLAIVRELAAAMGGSVSIGAAPTGGAHVTLTLPLP